MKVLTLILSTLILLLAVKPGVDLISAGPETNQSICDRTCFPMEENEKSPDKQNHKDDCNGLSCSLFHSCYLGSINGYAKPANESPKIEILSKIHFNYQSIFTSQFTSDFWQPPKIG